MDKKNKPGLLFWLGIAGLACLALPLFSRGFDCVLSFALQTGFIKRRMLGLIQYAFIIPAFVPSALLVMLNFRHDGTMRTIKLNVIIAALGFLYSLFFLVEFPYIFFRAVFKVDLEPMLELLAKFFKDPRAYIMGSKFMGIAFIALFLVYFAGLVVALIGRADPFAGARGPRK